VVKLHQIFAVSLSLSLSLYLHTLVLDGVYAEDNYATRLISFADRAGTALGEKLTWIFYLYAKILE